MEHYNVECEGVGRYVIVAQGEPPLPATFDNWKKAQSVADRLNARHPTDATATDEGKSAVAG